MSENADLTFKEEFWLWFDSLPEKAKRSYQLSHYDIAEQYFREFFYGNVQNDKL